MEGPAPREDIDSVYHSLTRRTRWMAIGGAAGLVAGLLITLVLKPIYQAQAALLLPQPDTNAMSLASMSSYKPVNILYGVVRSDRMWWAMAEKTGIPKREIEQRVDAKSDPAKNQLLVVSRDSSPESSLKLCKMAVDELAKLNREVGFSIASRQSALLKQALKEREDERAAVRKEISEYQKSMKTGAAGLDPTSVTIYFTLYQEADLRLKTTKRLIAEQNSRLSQFDKLPDVPVSPAAIEPFQTAVQQAQFEYESARHRLTDSNPVLQQLRQKFESSAQTYRREVRKQITSLRAGLTDESASLLADRFVYQAQRDFWQDKADAAPSEALKMAQLTEKAAALQAVIEQLQDRADEAEMNAQVDRLRWSMLGEPKVLPDPINKNYFQNGLVGLLLGLFAAGGYVIYKSSD